jgi:hypothetical protein
MTDERSVHGQADVVHLSDSLALANAEDMASPQCVASVEETVAILRKSREEWLQQQAASGRTK